MRASRAKLVDEPAGIDVTIVECPSCFAWVGWACGEAHCMGYHRKRISAAIRSMEKTAANPTEL